MSKRMQLGWGLFLASFAASALAPNADAGNFYRNLQVPHDGMARYLNLYVPGTFQPGNPAVFLLHGGTRDMHAVLKPGGASYAWVELAEEHGFLLIVPNGVHADTGRGYGRKQLWNDCRGDATGDTTADDVGFINLLTDLAIQYFGVDPTRVYASGASNGGMMSYRLAFELSDRIAAVAIFVANLPAVPDCAAATSPVPVFICNGDADLYMKWEGGAVVNDLRRGTVLSAQETLDFWVNHNGCNPEPVIDRDLPDIDPTDGARIHASAYTGEADVVFYQVIGGGHTLPTRSRPSSPLLRWLLRLGNECHDIEGIRHAWAFLSKQTL